MVYKHFVVHPDTVMDAHLAGCAAAKQDKFHEYEKAFWEQGFRAYAQTRDPSKLSKENVLEIAKGVGLDVKQLEADMTSQECQQRIASDMAELRKFGVSGTPSFFINGKFTMFAGPQQFKKMVDEAVAEVEKSGVPAGQYYQQVVMGQGLKEFRSKADAAKDKK